MAKTFTTALSMLLMDSLVEFAQRNRKIYEDLTDLEASPKRQVKIVVAPAKRFALDWGDDCFVLDQAAMAEVMVMVGFLMQEHEKLSNALQSYAFGLTLFRKVFGDWDGITDLKEAIHKPLAKLEQFEELNKTLGLDLDPDKNRLLRSHLLRSRRLNCTVTRISD